MTDPTNVNRRLVAVFAADVEGYSRLMGADEVGTLQGLTERRAILDRLIGQHRGRIANTAGDSVLAEFGSAVEAVQCAVTAQAALAEANAGVLPDKCINFRIGIHIGDVMVLAGDLFGDGVNIAARLQSIAKPGAVCISGATHDQVRKVLPMTFVDLGFQRVKNIHEQIRTYQVTLTETREAIADTLIAKAKSPRSVQDKPSIAVLPFKNLSGDPEQEYFADGIVEDITTALSRTGWLFVIARNSSFTYKGRAVDLKQVGHELGVRYLLEGSIRRAGTRVRITGRLIEAPTGGHVWGDRFEGAFTDIFELQDQITDSVVGAIEPSLRRAEIAHAWTKPTDNLDAYDLCLRGVHQIYMGTRESLDAAIGFLRDALASDPHYQLAKAQLAVAYSIRDTHGWAAPEERIVAIALAREALDAADDDPTTLRASGIALAYFADKLQGVDFAKAHTALNRALRLHPHSAQALHSLGYVHMWLGETEQAIDFFVRAIRVSPRDKEMGYRLHGLATSYLMCGKNAEALDAGLRAVEEMPKSGPNHRVVIVSLVRLGRLEEARETTARLLKILPECRLADIKPPSRIPGFAEGFLSDLQLAGYPA